MQLPMQVRVRRQSAAVLMFIIATCAGCSGQSLRLVTPDTTPGQRYTCRPGGTCEPAATDVPEDQNPAGTLFIMLPRECQGRIHQLIVLDAGSSHPTVEASCAPAEKPLGEME